MHRGHVVFGPFHLSVPRRLVQHLAAPGMLESRWLVAVVGVVAVLLVAGSIWGWRRSASAGRRARAHAAQAGVAAGMGGVVLAVALGVNAYVGYFPTVGDAVAVLTGASAAHGAPTVLAGQGFGGGRVVSAAASTPSRGSSVVNLSLPSRRLRMPNGNAYVYLPPDYTPTLRYPVLYLLGGAPGGPTDWLYAGHLEGTADALVRAHLAEPFIIVMPRISPTWRQDYEVLDSPGGPQVMTYLTQVVVPAVDARFSTVRSWTGRAVAGFSAGADGSLNLALHHQQMFAAAGAIVPEGWPGRGQWWVVHYDKQLMWRNSPIRYLPGLRFRHPMAFYLSGAGPQSDKPVATLARQLRADGQTVVVHDETGLGHNWRDARSDLPYLLQFMSKVFAQTAPSAA